MSTTPNSIPDNTPTKTGSPPASLAKQHGGGTLDVKFVDMADQTEFLREASGGFYLVAMLGSAFCGALITAAALVIIHWICDL